MDLCNRNHIHVACCKRTFGLVVISIFVAGQKSRTQ